jgi:hypothetical protein
MSPNRKAVMPLILVFFFLNIFFITSSGFLQKHNIDNNVLIIANAVLFSSNIVTLIMLMRALKNSNPNVFVRSMMAGTVIKLLIIAIALVAYVLALKKDINKPAIYISIFLYFLYLAVEVSIVLKFNKQK